MSGKLALVERKGTFAQTNARLEFKKECKSCPLFGKKVASLQHEFTLRLVRTVLVA